MASRVKTAAHMVRKDKYGHKRGLRRALPFNEELVCCAHVVVKSKCCGMKLTVHPQTTEKHNNGDGARTTLARVVARGILSNPHVFVVVACFHHPGTKELGPRTRKLLVSGKFF